MGEKKNDASPSSSMTMRWLGRRECGTVVEVLSKSVHWSGAAQGSADCRKSWSTAPDPTELGQRNSSHQCRKCRVGAGSLGWWKVQSSARRHEGTRAQQNRYRFAPARQNGAHECTRANRRTTGTFGRNRLLRRSWTEEASVSTDLIFSQLSGRQATPSQHAAHVLEEGKGPNLETVR